MANLQTVNQSQSNINQKMTEELLRQVETIVENSYDAIIGQSLDGMITSWNGGAVNMYGYTKEEAVGKSVSFMVPTELQSEILVLLNKIKAKEFIADYDSVRLRKDGTKIDIALSASPIKSEDGTVIGASIVERDITKRMMDKESMRQVELIVENSYDAIIGESLEGIITSWNGGAVHMYGYSKEEVIGKSVSFMVPPELHNEITILLNKIKAKEYIADYDSVRLRKDGTKIDIALSASPIKSDDGTVIGASIVERDITKRKVTDRQIHDLIEIRNKFITIISHQLRTPLTAINWNLEEILNGAFGKLEDTQQQFLQATHNSSMEISRRIQLLLTAIDIEENHIVYEMEEVSLVSLCTGVVNEFLNKIKMKNLAYTFIPPIADLPVAHCDSQKIRLVISTLVENAITYTNNGGKIIIALQLKGDHVRFEISDTGIGIPESEQHIIFTRFFRASNASLMLPDAFGLGLYVAKNFIEEHKGKIGFESKEGEGSVFWFEIPLKN